VAPSGLTPRERWLFALRRPTWVRWFSAGGLGLALGIAVEGRVEPALLVAGAVTLVCLTAAVVLLDPPLGKSPIDARSVRRAGWGMAAIALALSASIEVLGGRPGLTLGMAATLGLFLAPGWRARLGVEMYEMVAAGFAVPWWQAYCQSGVAMPRGLVVLPSFALLALATAMAAGLVGQRGSFVERFGVAAVRQAIEGLVVAALIVWGLLPVLAPRYCSVWMMLPPVTVLALEYRDLRRAGLAPDAATDYGLSRYRHQLDHGVWRGVFVLIAGILVTSVLVGGLG